VARITARINRAQTQITSGRRINVASDSPDEISRLLQIRSELAVNELARRNLGRLQTEVDGAEQALQHAVQLSERVRVLGAQGATGILTAADRATIGFEVGTILEQLVNLASTAVEGRYIFSGDADQTAAYTIDLDLDNPFSDYQGSESSRMAQHPGGTRFAVARTAEEIFDGGGGGASIFDAVNQLRLALRNDDEDAIQEAVAGLTPALRHLNDKLAVYGALQNQVQEAHDYANRQQIRLEQQVSELEDADLTQAILELNDAQFHQQAALGSEGKRLKTSLFDYLR
jgi:flagellar hook-associated protein 3 FlgL